MKLSRPDIEYGIIQKLRSYAVHLENERRMTELSGRDQEALCKVVIIIETLLYAEE